MSVNENASYEEEWMRPIPRMENGRKKHANDHDAIVNKERVEQGEPTGAYENS